MLYLIAAQRFVDVNIVGTSLTTKKAQVDNLALSFTRLFLQTKYERRVYPQSLSEENNVT